MYAAQFLQPVVTSSLGSTETKGEIWLDYYNNTFYPEENDLQ